MPDWTKSMKQSFEYYTVDPTSLADIDKIGTITSASFDRDSTAETLGSATIDAIESTGETYIRCYLNTLQKGIAEKFPIGLVLCQTPKTSFDGIVRNVSMDCYTPLIELKEKKPPLGYTIRKGSNIMDAAYRIISENARVPVNKVEHTYEKNSDGTLNDTSPTLYTDFVANTDDTWLSFIIDLISNAKYELELGERGDILFSPKQDIDSLQPVWTYNDDNSSILYPDITMNHDMYGTPNVVEVIYSYGNDYKQAVSRNEDINSPISIQNRGREIIQRVTDPNLQGYVTQEQIQTYADQLLKSLSTIEYTVSYKHAYCPVRVGDCVRLNYTKAGLNGIRAKVISQAIPCEPGCPVSEKATFTSKLWG